MTSIKILVVDDHALVRAGICSLLENLQGVSLVAEASSGHETLKVVEKIKPNLILLDVAMKDLNGIETLERLVKKYRDIRVIMISMHANEEYVLRALQAGASGYILKDAAPAELELAINAASRGDTYLSPAISKRIINDYFLRVRGESDKSKPKRKEEAFDPLTPRQREILQMVAEGRSTKEIAAELGVTIKTVETHRAQLMERLDLHDIASLVRYAIRKGIVSPDT